MIEKSNDGGRASRLTRYQCGDFFDSEYAGTGYWDEASQLQVIVPAIEADERPELDFLAIGRAGVDGILFGYRAGRKGLWAYYPISREFEPVAKSVTEFVQAWINGSIKL
jgi:hypothetical protein